MKHMILILALFAIHQELHAQWRVVETGSRGNLGGIALVGSSTVYVTGVRALMKSTDHGRTWTNLDSSMCYSTVQFKSDSIGWVALCQDSRFILRTTNGGASWFPSAEYQKGFIRSFDFVNRDTGLAITYDRSYGSSVLRTYDGGATWREVDTLGNENFGGHGKQAYGVKWYNSKVACVMGTPGVFRWTNDGGETWTETRNPHCTFQSDFTFINETTILAVGESSPVVRTTNQGKTWEPLQGIGTPMAIARADDSTVYSVGTGGFIVKSVDTGKTWLNDAYPVGITSDYDCTPRTNRCRLVRVVAKGVDNVWISGDTGGLLTLDNCDLGISSDSILGYRKVETHQVVTYALRNNPAYSYKWIATGGYMLGASTNHFCDVIWGYDKSGSVCCIVSDSVCADTICVTTAINNSPTGGIAGDDIETPTMSVKPNPAADMIDISTAMGEQFARYELVDVTGIVVQRTEGIAVRMSVSDVAPGVYHIVQRDVSGNIIGMQRVVVKR